MLADQTAGDAIGCQWVAVLQMVAIHSDLLCSTSPDLGRHKTYSSTEFLMAMIEDIVSEWI